jgi:hypothetical protein
MSSAISQTASAQYDESKRPGTRAGRGNYYHELRVQMRINEEQLYKLEDLLFVQRIKAIFHLFMSVLIIALLIAIGIILLSPNRFELVDRYSTLVNIGAVFLFFGLVETFSFFLSSLSLIREIRQLIRRHASALKEAEAEFAAA